MSIATITILHGAPGVPIYNGVIAMESNTIPYEFGNMANMDVKTTSTSGMGDIIYYELTHGHFPSHTALNNLIGAVLGTYGLTAVGGLIYAIVAAIYAGASVSVAVETVLVGIVSPEVESAILGAILAA